MKMGKMIMLCGVLCTLIGFMAIACEKEGPAEKAGKKMDKVLDSARETFKKLTDE